MVYTRQAINRKNSKEANLNQPILISITGMDRPGITATITKVLSEFNVNVLDIGQSVIHGLLSLSLLTEVENEEDLLKDLLFEASDIGIKLEYNLVEGHSSQIRHIV